MADKLPPICGADLERWRLANGLTKASAADALGLQITRWDDYTSETRIALPIPDPAVAILLHLYVKYPAASPVARRLDMREFCETLGLGDSTGDLIRLAALIGRSKSSAHRLLRHNGTPGRPTVRLVDAVQRLHLPKDETLRVLGEIVEEVGKRQGHADVFERGWEGRV